VKGAAACSSGNLPQGCIIAHEEYHRDYQQCQWASQKYAEFLAGIDTVSCAPAPPDCSHDSAISGLNTDMAALWSTMLFDIKNIDPSTRTVMEFEAFITTSHCLTWLMDDLGC